MIKFEKNNLIFISSVLILRLLLDVSYVYVVSKFYAYSGFNFNFSGLNYFNSWLFYMLSFFFVQSRMFKVSDYFFVTAMLSLIAPLTSLYGLDSLRPVFPVLVVLLSIYSIYFITRIKTISFKKIPFIKEGYKLAIIISVIFILFLLVWFYVSGVRFNLDLSKVYDFRRDNAKLSSFGILAYTNNWTYKVFTVYLIGIALQYNRKVLFFILVLCQGYFFAASAHKGVLFTPLLVLAVWFYFKKTNSLVALPIALCGVIFCTLISYQYYYDIFLTSLFSRRLFFVPADLTFQYFEFFTENPHVFWSNSVLSRFFEYPYGSLSLAEVIGVYSGSEANANNGFIASGFAHAGLLGISVYVIIIGFILKFINDICYKSMPLWLAVVLSIVPLRTLLISSDLLTVMVTHGFIVSIMLILLTRSKI